jgi:hypothetical protein
MLDTFFGAVQPEASLCFFYAKRTPLVDDSRHVIVGVGRVLSVSGSTEYKHKIIDPKKLRCVLWERNVSHSIRSDYADGFLFPYQELLRLAEKDTSIRPEELVAFAPEVHWDEFSYAAELVTHDRAVATLIESVGALEKIAKVISGPWERMTAWIDKELNRLWKMRGPFPGLGAALTALQIPKGNLVAYEIALLQESEPRAAADSWQVFEEVLGDPSRLHKDSPARIGPTYKKLWENYRTSAGRF